jgi:hypothetical protein
MVCPLGFVQPVMTDGITLGHPRCAVPSCREPLGNNQHHFCPTHFDKHNECAVRTCFDPVVSGSKMCTNPQHCRMESLNKAQSEAPFQIAKCMQRSQVSHPNNSMLEEISKSPDEEVDALEENIEWFEVEGDNEQVCRCIMSITQEGLVQRMRRRRDVHLKVGYNLLFYHCTTQSRGILFLSL